MICPICSREIKRKDRPTGEYWVFVCCECRKEFLIDRGVKDYSCIQFTGCAVSGRLHCWECSHSKINAEVKVEVEKGLVSA